MTTSQLTVERSPQVYARICGALYLYIMAAGTFAELFVRSRLVVSADAAATARNLLAHDHIYPHTDAHTRTHADPHRYPTPYAQLCGNDVEHPMCGLPQAIPGHGHALR